MALQLEDLTHQIIDAAMKVHTALRPGLLESAYQDCLLINFNVLSLKDGIKRLVGPAVANITP